MGLYFNFQEYLSSINWTTQTGTFDLRGYVICEVFHHPLCLIATFRNEEGRNITSILLKGTVSEAEALFYEDHFGSAAKFYKHKVFALLLSDGDNWDNEAIIKRIQHVKDGW